MQIVIDIKFGSKFQERVWKTMLVNYLYTFRTMFLSRHKKNNIDIVFEHNIDLKFDDIVVDTVCKLLKIND